MNFPQTIIPWEGPRSGDAILTNVIGQLKSTVWLEQCMHRADGKARMWQLIASHLPGRKPTECQERWRRLSLSRSDAR